MLKMLMLLSIALMLAGTALAHDDEVKKDGATHATRHDEDHGGSADADRQIPDRVTKEHWAYKEIEELGKKYAAEKKLSDAVMVEGKHCPKSELAYCLLSILDKIVGKHAKEGAEAIPANDLERIAALHEALKAELAQYEGYLTIRESIEKILAGPELPPFEHKVGVNGFLRGEGVGN